MKKEQFSYLTETDWLENNLSDPDLRVYDCTVFASLNNDDDNKFPFEFISGRDNFNEGHIPGAGFIDLLNDLSDRDSEYPFMMPSLQQFGNVAMNAGIGNECHVVLYSTAEPVWASRVWWMLRAVGFAKVSILNGGWKKWNQENRPVSKQPCQYPAARFIARLDDGFFADKTDVVAAMGDLRIRTINALPQPVFSGAGGPVFGRKGRIPGSVNVPFHSLHDPETGAYLPISEIREKFADVDVRAADQVIVYCGSGIAASNNAFALALLGHHDKVSVYDASLAEWGQDPLLPMETG